MKKFIVISLMLMLALVTSVAATTTFSPATVDLGTIGVGGSKDATLTLTAVNVASNVVVTYPTSVLFTGTGTTPTTALFSAMIDHTNAPKTLTSGTPLGGQFTVTVPPGTLAGTYSGPLELTTTDSATATISIPLTVMVSNTHAVTASALTLAVTYEGLQDDENNVTVSGTTTITNTGAFSETITIGSGSLAKPSILVTPAVTMVTLAPGASTTTEVSVKLPVEFSSGLQDAAKLELTFNNGQTATAAIKINVKSMLEITDVDVEIGDDDDRNLEDGDTINIDAGPEDKVVFSFTVDNLFDKDFNDGDIENIDLTVVIDDRDFGKDIDEEPRGGDFDVNAGKDKDKIEVEFEIPDDADEGDYDVIITAKGKDEAGNRHTDTMTLTLEVKLEDDDVRITRIEPSPLVLQCNRDANMRVFIKNHGSDSQDDVTITVDSPELGINEDFTGIELGDLGSSDDDANREFRVSLADSFAAGSYRVDVRVYRNGDQLEDDDHATVRVENCGSAIPSTESNGSTGTTVVVQPTPPVTTPPVTTPTTPTGGSVFDTVELPFTQTPLFLVLLVLGNVIVLGLIVFVIVKVAAK